MNNGLHGFHRKPRETGRVVKGIGGISSAAPQLSSTIVPSQHRSSELGRQRPTVVATEYATPFYVMSMVWTGSMWAILGETQFSTSTDLRTWTAPVTLPTPGTANIWSVLGWNGSQFIAVSEAKYISGNGDNFIYTAYSTTGASWNSGTTINAGAQNVLPNRDPVWTGSAWIVANGNLTGLLRSTDGATWSWILNNNTLYGNGSQIVVTNGSGIVFTPSASSNGILYSSDHGATWTQKAGCNAGLVCYDPFISKFVTLSYSYNGGYYATSTDGLSWSGFANTLGTNLQTASIAVTESQYLITLTTNSIMVVSKHPSDRDIAALSNSGLPLLQTINSYTKLLYGNSTIVAYTGIQVGLNFSTADAYISVLSLNNTAVQSYSSGAVASNFYYKL